MRVLLVIPDGLGIRNFLCTSFIDHLLSNGEVVIWHNLPDTTISQYSRLWKTVRWERMPAFREGLFERVFRQAKIYAQLYWHYDEDRSEVALRFRRPRGRLINRAIALSARGFGRVLRTQKGTIWLDRQHALRTLRADYLRAFEEFLSRTRPDVVFCTHQRASQAVPAMIAARKLGIATATFIYSWDNPPKGRMAVHADYFFAWSDAMKAELLRYYPEVSADRICVVGTPQFEHYFDASLVRPRDEFFRGLGLDPERPVVCFSGDDVTTSPHDEMYLADLAWALRRIPGDSRPQLLFRRCPVDSGKRYRSVLREYPEIVASDPLWLSCVDDDWTQSTPTREDVALLLNVVSHCDLVVNVASTVCMDFAILDKPGIYIAYNQEGADDEWNIADVYRLPHFRSVHELQPIYWARSKAELPEIIMHALSNCREKSLARRSWVMRTAKEPLSEASARCFHSLRRIAISRQS
jgi:hypothetical protein